MAQSRVITHDQETRLSVKARLAAKIEQTLTPVVEAIKEKEVLLIPSNYEKLSEGELLFTLANNTELQHSQDSALRTLGILKGKLPFPKGLTLKPIELESPVKLPEFAIEAPVQRKISTIAPGFEKTQVVDDYRTAAENVKKEEFKLALAHKIEEALLPKPEKVQRVVRPLVQTYDSPPANHSLATEVDTIPQYTSKKPSKNKRAKRVKTPRGERIETLTSEGWQLPDNSLELSENELHYILTRDPEYKYTPESAQYVIDVLFNEAPIHIEVSPDLSVKDISTGSIPTEDENVLLLPSNYRDFSDVDLHEILQSAPELGHTEDSAILAMKILRGWEKPIKFVLKTSEFSAEVKAPEPKQIKRNVKERIEPTPPPWFVFNNTPELVKAKVERVKRNTEPTIVLFPSNYADFSTDTDLHKALIDTIELGHTQESALLAMQAYRGWTNPTEVVLKPTDIVAQVPDAKSAGRWVYVKEE